MELYLDSAFTIFTQENLLLDQKKVWELRSELYIKSGDFEQATLALKAKEALADSLFTADNRERLAQLQARYWSEKKQFELEMARQSEKLQRLQAEQHLADKEQSVFQRNLVVILFLVLTILGFIIYRLIYLWKKNQVLHLLGEKELKAIRSQLNPHFLFQRAQCHPESG